VTDANVCTGATLSSPGNTSIVALPAGAGRSGRAGGQSPGRVERRAGPASTPDELPSPGGLVPYAITVRGQERDADWSIAGLWRPAFPGAEPGRACLEPAGSMARAKTDDVSHASSAFSQLWARERPGYVLCRDGMALEKAGESRRSISRVPHVKQMIGTGHHVVLGMRSP
jgi:hypothetical protein